MGLGGGEFYRAGGVLWVWGLLWAWGGPVGLKGFYGAEGVSMGLGWGFCGAGEVLSRWGGSIGLRWSYGARG